MKQLTLVLLFSTCLIIASCTMRKSSYEFSPTVSTKLHIQKLIAKNLSEDMSVLSTHEDEIVLMIHAVSRDTSLAPVRRLYAVHTIMTKKDSLHRVNYHIGLDTSNDILATLVELDIDNSMSEVLAITDSLVNHYKTKYIDIRSTALDSAFGDNDLLGVVKIPQQNLSKERTAIGIEGLQMFDRYNYELHVYYE